MAEMDFETASGQELDRWYRHYTGGTYESFAALRDRIVAECARPVAITEAEAERIAERVFNEYHANTAGNLSEWGWEGWSNPQRKRFVALVLAGAAAVRPDDATVREAERRGAFEALTRVEEDSHHWEIAESAARTVRIGLASWRKSYAPPAAPLTVTLSGDRVVTAVRYENGWRVSTSWAVGHVYSVHFGWATTPDDAEALASLARQMREEK